MNINITGLKMTILGQNMLLILLDVINSFITQIIRAQQSVRHCSNPQNSSWVGFTSGSTLRRGENILPPPGSK